MQFRLVAALLAAAVAVSATPVPGVLSALEGLTGTSDSSSYSGSQSDPSEGASTVSAPSEGASALSKIKARQAPESGSSGAGNICGNGNTLSCCNSNDESALAYVLRGLCVKIQSLANSDATLAASTLSFAPSQVIDHFQ